MNERNFKTNKPEHEYRARAKCVFIQASGTGTEYQCRDMFNVSPMCLFDSWVGLVGGCERFIVCVSYHH